MATATGRPLIGKAHGKTVRCTEIIWHRNGVCGLGFYAIRFSAAWDDDRDRHYVAQVFQDGGGEKAYGVFELDGQGRPDLTRTMRGDYFIEALTHAIRLHVRRERRTDAQREAGRLRSEAARIKHRLTIEAQG